MPYIRPQFRDEVTFAPMVYDPAVGPQLNPGHWALLGQTQPRGQTGWERDPENDGVVPLIGTSVVLDAERAPPDEEAATPRVTYVPKPWYQRPVILLALAAVAYAVTRKRAT